MRDITIYQAYLEISNITMSETKRNKSIILVSSIIVAIVCIIPIYFTKSDIFLSVNPKSYQDQSKLKQGQYTLPSVKDNSLKVEQVTNGLTFPTSMAFIDNNNILVLEKNTGHVRLISNGIMQNQPVLKVKVNSENELGLLGIAILKDIDYRQIYYQDDVTNKKVANAVNNNTAGKTRETNNATTYAFLYFTELKNKTNSSSEDMLRNSIYRYEWNGKSLVNPALIFTLPAKPGLYHDGGKLVIGPDNSLYAVIGDLNSIYGTAQNHDSRRESNGTSGILRINPINGSPVKDNPFIPQYSENNNTDNARLTPYYYAYGIRNSFGIAFDPVTRILWDTENGEDKYDEINIVKPGFNSGWHKITGPVSANKMTEKDLISVPESNYSDPVFSWRYAIGVTDIEFLKSSKLGEKYKNNLFVGDINNGNLYYFQLNETRTGLKFNSSGLSDMVVDNKNELSGITFAAGFKGITDIKTGPDGCLYILSYLDGKLYRIVLS
jgi:aldose sugar dehydrogenase